MRNKEVVMKKRYMESTGRTRRVSPRMMEYLRWVIDTPTAGAWGKDNGKAPDDTIGIKMFVTAGRVGQYRSSFERMFTKEEVLELCEEIMKEAA
jgi:hypothetical protein